MKIEILLRLAFGLALVALGLLAVVRRRAALRWRRKRAPYGTPGVVDMRLQGGPAVLVGATAAVTGARLVLPLALTWLRSGALEAPPLPIGAVFLLFVGSAAAVLWHLARRAKVLWGEGKVQGLVGEKLEQAMREHRDESRPGS